MNPFLERGDLAATPLASLLLAAVDAHATGAVEVERDGARSRVFVRDGLPAGAQSFATFRPLGQILVQAGRIDMGTLSRSLVEMARAQRPQGEILVELGAVTREEVQRALVEQQVGYLRDIAGQSAGQFTWSAGELPDWTRNARLPPLRALLAALEAPPSRAVVEAALEQVSSVALAPAYDRVAHAFAWDAEEAAAVERLRVAGPAARFLADPVLGPERAAAVLALLVRLGLAGAPGAAPALPAAVGRLEAPAAPAPEPAAPAAHPSDPEAARALRHRLLERGLRNVGVGPFSGRAEPPPAPAPPAPPPPASAQRPAAHAAPPAAPSPSPYTSRAEMARSRSASVAEGPPVAGVATDLRAALTAWMPRARAPDLFGRLGVPRTATRDEVKHAFLALAKKFHPDRFHGPALRDLGGAVQELFASLNEAYETLADDRRRAEYLAASGNAWVSDAAGARVDFEKGEACLRTRDPHKARAFYEAAVRADPRAEYLAALAQAMLAEPQPDRAKARELLKRALADPGCDRAAWVAGLLAREERDEAAAERHFRAALAANPRHVEAAREVRLIEMRRAREPRK